MAIFTSLYLPWDPYKLCWKKKNVFFLRKIFYFPICLTSNKLCWIEDQLANVATRFYTLASWTIGNLTVTGQPHPVWWSQYHKSIYRYKALTKNSSEYHCQKCLRCMVTLIMIDNEQSLLLGEVHCRSQEIWGEKNDFRMQSGTLGERQTKKVLLLCMSLPELCAAHQEIWFLNCTSQTH